MSGFEVTLIARGAHHAAIRGEGLRLVAPDGDHRLHLPVVDHPRTLAIGADDVVLLCMKSQHTEAALLDLRAAAHRHTAIVCVQNGVANERIAARYFERVYGMVVVLPAVHLQPGTVVTHAASVGGMLDVGRYPCGVDSASTAIAEALSRAGFTSQADPRIMRLKYAKLLSNLNNALQAAVGLDVDAREVSRQLRTEALACYAAAAIDCASADEMKLRLRDGPTTVAVEGMPRGGGSSWQSLARGAADMETDYLNGEITLLGRLHGVPTPANEALQAIAAQLIRERAQPGSLSVAQVASRIQSATG
ncbi:MAG: ketopantoate reductase family protein [Gammaproteobacteria bacterium]|nr:ketopantoate reductase family protein [Gammaproteobacteria bacterium]